jgi:SagB-type dehydrogenase family enzyme
LLSYLVGAGIAGYHGADGLTEDTDPALLPWEFHDLLFHARSRMGRHDYPSGATYPFLNVIDPAPATKAPMSSEAVSLPPAPLDTLDVVDPPLTRVVETRRSMRHHAAEPITIGQLGEFLHRVGRVRALTEREPGGEPPYATSSRPYPSGGACYDLELYITVRTCHGLAPGMYHYDPLGHRLHRLPALDATLDGLLRDAARSAGITALPQVLITITSRFQRVSWKYRSIAYATTLKGVGVLYGAMYLAATAMGLAACALGNGNADLVALAAGLDYLVESSVGEFMLGTPAPGEAPEASTVVDDGR